MKKQHRSAMGQSIDMDSLRLANEEAIAVGNMKVNARGDELGPGGTVVRTRNQVMNDYYKLNTPIPIDSTQLVSDEPAPKAAEPITPAQAAKLKGSLANSFSKNNHDS